MKLLKPFIFVAIAATFTVPATAGNANVSAGTNQVGVQVSYADLDISSKTGAKVLYARLKSASRALCGTQNSVSEAGSIRQLKRNKECFDQTLARSINKVDNSTFRSLYAS